MSFSCRGKRVLTVGRKEVVERVTPVNFHFLQSNFGCVVKLILQNVEFGMKKSAEQPACGRILKLGIRWKIVKICENLLKTLFFKFGSEAGKKALVGLSRKPTLSGERCPVLM